jgi:hypothetical protein
MINWQIKGSEFINCNCAYGCPCQFNALPTDGSCRAAMAYQFHEGHFGEVKLDGLRAVELVAWPGPIHQGNGEMQIIIDERASAEQRGALENIMTGKETKDMATMWWIFTAMCTTRHKTLFKPIEMEVDVEGRRGRFSVAGIVEATGEPILNPVTGKVHRARIDLPNGFEYRMAEIGSGTTRATGDIKLNFSKSYGQFANIHLGSEGRLN